MIPLLPQPLSTTPQHHGRPSPLPPLLAISLLALTLPACPAPMEVQRVSGDLSPGDVSANAGITGYVTLHSEYNGEADCNTISSFKGSPFPGILPVELEGTLGTCAGCEAAYAIEGEYVADRNSAECLRYPWYSLVADPPAVSRLFLAFAPTWVDEATGATWHDALLYNYHDEESRPSGWTVFAADETENATVVRTEDELAWTGLFVGEATKQRPWQSLYCGHGYTRGPSLATRADFERATGTLPCNELDEEPTLDLEDLWEFRATPGVEVTLSVDATSSAEAFDPYVYVLGSDACIVYAAGDDMPCAYPLHPGAKCPSTRFVAEETWYQVIVMARTSVRTEPDCAGPTAGYGIWLDGGRQLTLVYDDIPAWQPARTTWRTSVSGVARRAP